MFIRAFIALPIPETVKVEIERAQEETSAGVAGALRALDKAGPVSSDVAIPGQCGGNAGVRIGRGRRGRLLGFPALQLRAERIGCFPDLRFPRVAWVWVHDEADRLGDLQKAVAQATVPFARSDTDKKFTGHVTLARTHGIKRSEAETLATLAHAMNGRFFGEWTADQVELMRSELLEDGARHSVVAAFGLKA